MEIRGWDSCDFIFISGDAYIDHPSFAAALLCRMLESAGFRTGIIPQPDWKNTSSFTVLGRPRLGFLIGAGNMDSMVAHYTAARRKRSEDAYSPGGKSGLRPDRATLVYTEGVRRTYKDTAVIIGGIEASLRRFAHYDYWSNTVRRSILLDSKADILVYGMGEKPLNDIARRLAAGENISAVRNVRGTCVGVHGMENVDEWKNKLFLPDYEAVKDIDDKSLRAYAEHFMIQKNNADPLNGKPLVERSDGDRYVIQNPPSFPLTSEELDKIYELPFTRRAHPMYNDAVPALNEAAFSLVSSRGCYGGCSFCAITFHQGRTVTGRSKKSLIREAKHLTTLPGFKGYINDVGGPTANFYGPACEKQARGGFCAKHECLFPEPCPHFKADHGAYLEILRTLRKLPGVKKVFVRSGLRFDLIRHDKKHGKEFLETLCKYHVSGQLKAAPEHISANVLEAMGKSGYDCYVQFKKDFDSINKRLGIKQYLLPYFISAHPGAALADAVELALYLKRTGFIPEQTQDFYPVPGTLSTVMYHTGLDPRSMKKIYVTKGERERRQQRALLHFNDKNNRKQVIDALKEAGREDLIGATPDCLIR
jgi:uncharacterized radical SAM protein YgiQ